MRTLHEAIQAHAKGATPALMKYLDAMGLNDWEDLTKANLNDLRDYILSQVAHSTARTYFAVFKAILKRYEDDAPICKEYASILKAKLEKPVKTFLTMKELEQLERVEPESANEQYVLDVFLIGAFTGMRVSDAMQISEENMANGCISYVSIKTGVQAVVPMKKGIAERVRRVQSNECEMPVMTYNRIIRRLCQRAGITEQVKVFKAGDHKKGEKWEYVTSHTARQSFATNLNILGLSVVDIAKLLGHQNIHTTMRYIVNNTVTIDNKALRYFK